MENFDLGTHKGRRETGGDELKMSVSPVFIKDGIKKAYVSFSDGYREAEGVIPDCIIKRNRGFNPEEVSQLKDYLKNECPELMKIADRINVMDAFMGRKKDTP
ncbi:MAG: hypothetical protein J6P45_09415 [Lachnospiraceae bacterium]|nr:hypothetical protein [Lachnospiraceae bacterium]